MRACLSCGSRSSDTAFPPRGRLCTDCSEERAPEPPPIAPAITRARYRAALRYRARQPQMDLIDLVVPAP